MKTRIISSLVGLAILAVVAVFLHTPLLNVIVLLLAVVGVVELLKATGVLRNKGLTALSLILTVLIPFARWDQVRPLVAQAVFVLIILYFIVLLRCHATVRMEQVAMAAFFSTVIPAFFSCAVYVRDDFGRELGGYYILLALGAAWLSDTGAYFVGMRFGKHKLAPNVSPKKTVEGSVGGVVVCTVFMLLLSLVYSGIVNALGFPVRVSYPLVLAVTPALSVIGMLGDLSASMIKRNFGVKDFGNIMPGHGGVLDRFDSVLFTLPSVYLLSHHLEIVAHI